MLHTVHRLARADAVGVVLVGRHDGVGRFPLHQLAAVPDQEIPLGEYGISDGVIHDAAACELISPSRGGVRVGLTFQLGTEGHLRVRIGLLARAVAGIIVSVYVGLAQRLVVLAEELAEVVVDVGGLLSVAVPLPAEPNTLRVG